MVLYVISDNPDFDIVLDMSTDATMRAKMQSARKSQGGGGSGAEWCMHIQDRCDKQGWVAHR